MQRLRWDCNYSRGFEVLSQDGLTWIALGMDFSRVQATRYPDSKHGCDLLCDDVLKLRKVYFPIRVYDFFWDVDLPPHYQPMARETPGGLKQHERVGEKLPALHGGSRHGLLAPPGDISRPPPDACAFFEKEAPATPSFRISCENLLKVPPGPARFALQGAGICS